MIKTQKIQKWIEASWEYEIIKWFLWSDGKLKSNENDFCFSPVLISNLGKFLCKLDSLHCSDVKESSAGKKRQRGEEQMLNEQLTCKYQKSKIWKREDGGKSRGEKTKWQEEESNASLSWRMEQKAVERCI